MLLKCSRKNIKKTVDKEHIVLYNTNDKRTISTKRGEKMKEKSLKDLRTEKGLTQEELAKKSGFSKDYISMLERGERNPSDKAKAIFAEIFNVPIVQIFLAIHRTKCTIKEREVK